MDIRNLVVVITGGASGIGECIAKDMAAAGAKVVIGDLGQGAMDRVVDEIKKAGGDAVGIIANVTSEADMSNLMDKAIEKFGSINVVLANAGVIKDGMMLSLDKDTRKVKKTMSLQDFKFVIDVNLIGAFLTFREGARRMVDNGWKGVLIAVASINKTGQVGQLNYSSTKAAVALWPKILAGEFHMRGIKDIRVVSVSPGYAATPILKGMNQDALNALIKEIHIQRLVEPSEISAAVKHIVENEGIDATDIEVTGGISYTKSRAR